MKRGRQWSEDAAADVPAWSRARASRGLGKARRPPSFAPSGLTRRKASRRAATPSSH